MPLEADVLVDRRRLKRRLFFWRFAAIVSLVALVAVALGEYRGDWGSRDHVARLTVQGIILEDRDRENMLRHVAQDSNAKALVLYVNSPGGSTFGGEALYRALREVAENKPVVAVIGTLGASGGYMISLGAERIFARENSVTGSIGVIWQTAEFSGLMERLGVSAEAITSGPLKGKPSPFNPITPPVRKAAQQLVDATHLWFVDLVAERRSLDPGVASRLADGRVFTGAQALANGLVDALGGEEDARKWLEESHGVDRDLPLVEVTYGEKEDFLGRFASSITEALTGKSFLSERVTLDGLISVWHPSL